MTCLPVVREGFQRAAFAPGHWAAVVLADGHELGMIIVIQVGLRGQRRLKKFLYRLVIILRRYEPVTEHYSVGVGIYHECCLARGVEDDAVGRLPADSVYGQQFLAQGRYGAVEERPDILAVRLENVIDEIPQPLCLDVEVAGRAYEFR